MIPNDALGAVPSLAGIVLYLAIIAALVHKYRRTRDQGFLWLGVPLVIWPLLGVPLGYLFQHAVDKLISGGQVGFFPFTLVEQGKTTVGNLVVVLVSVRQLVWSGLMLAAVLMLRKAKAGETPSRA
jgi:hypothetical protein